MRKIIHIDMDCFYASIEVRDNPELKGKPVAVGGTRDQRGVLCTCNYEARAYGVRSAMPTFQAFRLCPDLITLPVNMEKYRQESQKIRGIFHKYTHLVEPLSLDEAFLDVSDCTEYKGSATLIAKAIRQEIVDQLNITASAGIAPNKFLAKVASDWNKPNGQFVIPPEDVAAFVYQLPVKKIFGVGKVTAKKFEQIGISTCGELQDLSREQLIKQFGKFGLRLYELSRGIDHREVETKRDRKSLSVETTFSEDIDNIAICHKSISQLFTRLEQRLQYSSKNKIHKQFVKIKFADFTHTSVECISHDLQFDIFHELLDEGIHRQNKPVRLLGIGVRFYPDVMEQQLEIDV